MPSVAILKQRLAQTLKARKLEAALGMVNLLANEQPEDPNWPRRAARLMHATSDFEGELAAHRRALALEVESGQVLDAIASCNAILSLHRDDRQALKALDLIHADAANRNSGESKSHPLRDSSTDAPLDSMLLTELVPEARAAQFADAQPEGINEIPIEASSSAHDEAVLNLRLDEWTPPADLKDLAAAQTACLPTPADLANRSDSTFGAPGASLRRELANTPLFGDLDSKSLHALINKVRVVILEAGQILFRQGDAANSLYVVVDGAVVPIAEGDRRRKLAVLERGEFFGEIGLMTKQPRNATIEAIVDTKLLAIDRRVLWELIGKQPSVAKSILRFLRSRLIDRQIRTNIFFAAFAYADREAVARQFRVLEVQDGARIVEQGKPTEGLFVVLSGSLAKVDRLRDKEFGDFSLGDVFGGLSMLEGQPMDFDVIARGKCWLVMLGEGRFRRILAANPQLGRVVRRLTNEGQSAKGSASIAGL